MSTSIVWWRRVYRRLSRQVIGYVLLVTAYESFGVWWLYREQPRTDPKYVLLVVAAVAIGFIGDYVLDSDWSIMSIPTGMSVIATLIIVMTGIVTGAIDVAWIITLPITTIVVFLHVMILNTIYFGGAAVCGALIAMTIRKRAWR